MILHIARLYTVCRIHVVLASVEWVVLWASTIGYLLKPYVMIRVRQKPFLVPASVHDANLQFSRIGEQKESEVVLKSDMFTLLKS